MLFHVRHLYLVESKDWISNFLVFLPLRLKDAQATKTHATNTGENDNGVTSIISLAYYPIC